MRTGLLAMIAAAAALHAAPARAQSLDYEFFKARVEPIFLKKKPGHTRCYVCHAESNNAFRLEKLPPGARRLENAGPVGERAEAGQEQVIPAAVRRKQNHTSWQRDALRLVAA